MTSSSPTVTELRAELRALQNKNHELGTRNAKLAELLKASRDKLQVLYEELEGLNTPPSTYGTYLGTEDNGRSAEVFTGNRHMRLMIDPTLDRASLVPGIRVRLGEGSVVVEACGHTDSGQLATLTETIDGNRALVQDHSGEEVVVKLAGALQTGDRAPRPGDTLLVDTKAGYAFEVIPKTEVNRLALEIVPDVTYADVGGLHNQIEQIQDAVELPFAHPELFQAYELHPPKGVLLYGPPGCGKTMIAQAVAHSLAVRMGSESGSYFLNIKGPELLNKYVGETERQIRLIFERARELASDGKPVIIFFDEMESIFRTRGSGVSSDMETTVVPQLLAELDGVEKLSNVIVIGATNREELIDPAILRPGRLDVKIRVDRPSQSAAADIFAKHIRSDLPLAAPAELLIDAAVTHIYADRPFVELTYSTGEQEILHYRDFVSGAMIANVVSRAKKLAIKDHLAGCGSGITVDHLISAIDAENRENEDLPNTSSPDEWARIAATGVSRHAGTITNVRIIG
ncbi:proteasome ATPase [Corynebacterium epidermidicanis]|uniref:AAA ATPase forming ring-shaped complexes n=1 Tax=Corynebacterium epidermidicanis TaxID=1050174 RepID=A0A0G3GPT6_9CORY|nr:proteasome ATPase [Corynebacterium epidermidicanis]AKK03139.1 proteasome ATPase [Corynebacterium epidermidicanis]